MSINVGLLGLGNIGTGVAEYLRDHGSRFDLTLKTVAEVDAEKHKGANLSKSRLTSDPSDVLKDPQIQIVVELIGGEHPAREFLLEAIANGKAIVTANKFAISKFSNEIFDNARKKGVDVGFEASSGGGIPIIQTLREDLIPNDITLIIGIVNGTTNYILTKMGDGMDYKDALKIAQEKGFAERDPYLDVSGQDAKHKLAILTSIAWNTWIDPNSIPCEGISEITSQDIDFAAEFGYRIKLLATGRKHGNRIELRVNPALVSVSHPLSQVMNEFNAVYLEGNFCGPQMFYGKGAGRTATTSAVVADIIRIATNIRKGIHDELPTFKNRYEVLEDPISSGYFRLGLKHIPGSLAKVSTIMGQLGISIKDSVQRNKFRRSVDGETVIPDIITVEPIPDSKAKKALSELEKCDRVHGKPFYLRVEE